MARDVIVKNQRTRTGTQGERIQLAQLNSFVECLFECAPLCIIWGDDPIGNVLLLEVFCEECVSLDLLWILMMQLTWFSFHTVVVLTIMLFPSAFSRLVPRLHQ
jgi:hypothetical protein